MNKLFEAFKAISSSFGLDESTMNEKAFEVDKEGIEDMEKFVDVDENGTDDNDFSLRKFDDLDEVEVFDDHAPVEEKEPEDHTGQAILECSICHSNIFRDKDDVEINEEGTLADEGKECPYCGNPDGYYVVGMVEPFTTGEEEETKEEVKETEDETEEKEETEVETEKKEVKEESFRGIKTHKRLRESVDPFAYDIAENIAREIRKVGMMGFEEVDNLILDMYDGDLREIEQDVFTLLNYEGINTNYATGDFYTDEYAEQHPEVLEESRKSCKDGSCKKKDEAFPIGAALAGAAVGALGTKLLSDSVDEKKTERKKGAVVEAVKSRHLCKDNLTEAPIYGLEPKHDARRSFYGKAQVDVNGDRQTLYSYNTKVAEIKDGKVTLFPAWNYSMTTLRHVKDFLKQNGFKADSSKQISTDYEVIDESMNEGCHGKKLKEDDQAANVVDKYQEWVDYDMKKYGRISGITKKKLDKAGFEVVKDDHGDYEVIAKDKKELGESLDKVEIETENEKITVSSEPKETEVVETEVEVPTEEVVGEVTEEEADEMVDGEEEDVDVDEVDTETLDQANESYLKENYSNVRSYKTTFVKELGGKLVVEGLITFKSGNKKKTSFIYEAASKKGNKLKFIGENKQIAAGKKAFRLNASLKDGKVITESLNYKYTVKDNGKSAIVSGTSRPIKK